MSINYKECPVCHSEKTRQLRYDEGNRNNDWTIRICQGRAKKSGCGHVFKNRQENARINGCAKVLHKASAATSIEHDLRIGYTMIQALKDANLHDPHRRTIRANVVYGCYFDNVAPRLIAAGLCTCGCGLPARVPHSKRGHELASSQRCQNRIYNIAQMIAGSNLEGLRVLLGEVCGLYCQHCKKVATWASSFEVDHVVEVAQGGGMCWIDNLQLLCPDCHKAKTANFATLRARQNRDKKAK